MASQICKKIPKHQGGNKIANVETLRDTLRNNYHLPLTTEDKYPDVELEESLYSPSQKAVKDWLVARKATGKYEDQLGRGNLERQKINLASSITNKDRYAFASDRAVNMSGGFRDLDVDRFKRLYSKELGDLNYSAGAYSKLTHSQFAEQGPQFNRGTHQRHESAHAANAIPQQSKIEKILSTEPMAKDEYLDSPTEVHSRLMQMRLDNNFDPNRTWKIEDVEWLKKLDEKNEYNIFKRYTPENALKLLNEVAQNKTTSTDVPMAKDGTVLKHQLGNVITPNTSGKQKKLPRQRFKEVNPATIKYPHERAAIMKNQEGNKVKPYITTDPKDPRIQAYNDSLLVHNTYKSWADYMNNPKTSADEFTQFLKSKDNYKENQGVWKQHDMSAANADDKEAEDAIKRLRKDTSKGIYSPKDFTTRDWGSTFNALTLGFLGEGRMGTLPIYEKPKQEVILASNPTVSPLKTISRRPDRIAKIPSKSIDLQSIPSTNKLAVSKDYAKYNDLKMRPLWANIAKQDSTQNIGTLKGLDSEFKEGFNITQARQFPQEIKDKFGLNYIDSNITKRQQGGSLVDPKLMEYLQKKGYPQGQTTQPLLEQGKDNVKPTRAQAQSIKIKNALSTAGTGLQDIGTNVLTMGTQLRKPTEEEIQRGRGSWGQRAPVIANAVTAGIANELIGGGMNAIARKIAQRTASKMLPSMVTEEAPKIIQAPRIIPETAPGPRLQFKKPEIVNHPWIQRKSPVEVFQLDLNRSSIKDTPWSMDIGFEASAGKPNTGLVTKMQKGDSKNVSFLNYNPFITENSYAGSPLVTHGNLQGVLEKLKPNSEGSFIKRAHITPEHAILEKVRDEFEREVPHITSELHQLHRPITPVHQSLIFHTGNPFNDDLFSRNLQIQKTAPGKYLYDNNYKNLNNEAIEEALEALNEGRKRGLRFDFNGANNTLYDPKANKFSFIDMGVYPRSYNVNDPLFEFRKQLIHGIHHKDFNEGRKLIRSKGLNILSNKEGGKINE